MFLTNTERKGLADYLRGHEHTSGIIVSEERKFIYMKATKTAGSAILHGIFDSVIPDIMYKQSKNNSGKFDLWLTNITDEDLKNYFIFTVIRNPFDRFVSNAAYFRMSFDNLVNNYEKLWEENPNLKHHCRPIHYYTHFNGKRFADMICRYETLQFDFNLVCDHIGIERIKIPVVNKSRHKHYSAYYNSQEKISLVEKLYEKDILYYGYELEKQSVVKQSYLYYHINHRLCQLKEKFLNKRYKKQV